MAKPTEELPIDRYNREIRQLWEKARTMSELSLIELIDTLTAFSARIVGVSYNPQHKSDTDSEYSNQQGNIMLLKLKQEVAARFRRLEGNREQSLA